MDITNLIKELDIEKADAVILRNKKFGLVDHYAIFIGFQDNEPVFVANYEKGVKKLSGNEINEMLDFLEPIAVEKFTGNSFERKRAIKRALSRVGEKDYNYITNNCEHFKNWVHTGNHKSDQVSVAADISLMLGVGASIHAIANKSLGSAAAAAGLFILGAFLNDAAENPNYTMLLNQD